MLRLLSLALLGVLASSVSTAPAQGEWVTVEVLDHTGAPVEGVPVAGVALDADGEAKRAPLFRLGGVTDSEGEARLRAWRRHDVYAASLFDGRITLSDEEAPLRIVLPPVGALSIDLERYPDARRLRLRDDAGGLWISAQLTHGLRVQRIPFGLTLCVEASGPDGDVIEAIAGPTERAPVVWWTPEPKDFLVVSARLVDENGVGMPEMSARLWNRSRSIVLRPSGEGGVEGLVLRSRWELQPGERAVVREIDGDRQDAGLLEGEVRAPAMILDDVVDLGDVVLGSHSFLTAGRVLDAEGAPVEGARVRLQYFGSVPDELADERAQMRAGFDLNPSEFGALTDGRASAAFASVDFTDSDGAFELRTAHALHRKDPPLLFVEAKGPGAAAATARAPLRAGARDVELRLVPDGMVSIGLRSVPDPIRSCIVVRPRRVDDMLAHDMPAERLRQRPQDGRIGIAVPPGAYDLDLRYCADGWTFTTVATIEGVDVPPAAPATDVRLIAPALPLRTVTLRRPDGEPLSGLRIEVVTEHDARQFGSPTLVDAETGLVTWLALPRAQHLFVDVSGYAPVDLFDVHMGDEVILVPTKPVRLVLEGDSAPELGTFGVRTAAPGWPADSPLGAAARCDDESRGGCWMLAPGATYRIHVYGAGPAGRGASEGGRESDPTPWHGRLFRVPEGADEVVLGED